MHGIKNNIEYCLQSKYINAYFWTFLHYFHIFICLGFCTHRKLSSAANKCSVWQLVSWTNTNKWIDVYSYTWQANCLTYVNVIVHNNSPVPPAPYNVFFFYVRVHFICVYKLCFYAELYIQSQSIATRSRVQRPYPTNKTLCHFWLMQTSGRTEDESFESTANFAYKNFNGI